MSTTTVKLLQAAADIAGGRKALAARLGVGETLLSKFMADSIELPDLLLLRAVDLILEDREPRPVAAVGASPTEFPAGSLQNSGDGSRPASGTEP